MTHGISASARASASLTGTRITYDDMHQHTPEDVACITYDDMHEHTPEDVACARHSVCVRARVVVCVYCCGGVAQAYPAVFCRVRSLLEKQTCVCVFAFLYQN